MKKLGIVLLLFVSAAVFGQQKFALVIGNGNYANVTRLANPVNDAGDMANALQSLGFTVDKLLDGSQDQMVSAVMRLKNRLSVSNDSYGFLFYAGHGIQSNGENYLIPVDANIPDANFLRNRAVAVQEVLDELNDAGNKFNMVVLDACRDNPFGWSRGGARGLTIVSRQPADSIIVYSTSAGSTASDGTGRNGLFTGYLLKNITIPGLEVTEMLRRTNADVARASNNSQRPAVYNQFYGIAYLGAKPETADSAQAAIYGTWYSAPEKMTYIISGKTISFTNDSQNWHAAADINSIQPVKNDTQATQGTYPSGFRIIGVVTDSNIPSIPVGGTHDRTFYLAAGNQSMIRSDLSKDTVWTRK
ncbi:MAG: caspase family protein [Treponema sp.]|nr:caspase family protein [Treponema sp.]